jgi:hypothetical protein
VQPLLPSISAADAAAVLAADANPSALLSIPCNGQLCCAGVAATHHVHIMLGHAHMAALACCIRPEAKAHTCGTGGFLGCHLLWQQAQQQAPGCQPAKATRRPLLPRPDEPACSCNRLI